jgi:hypothetical protein
LEEPPILEIQVQLERNAINASIYGLASGPAFRVINAKDRPVGTNSLVGEALSREQIIGKPIAQMIFGISDTVILEDHRISTLRESNT